MSVSSSGSSDALARVVAGVVLAVASVRALVVAALHARPTLGGHEAADLARIGFLHSGLGAREAPSFLDRVQADGLKGPLYYAGAAVLQGGLDRVSPFVLITINVVAMVVAGLVVRGVVARDAGAWWGTAALAVFLLLPGTFGMVPKIGAEFCHTALLVGSVMQMQRILGRPSLEGGALLGMLVGAGALVKWNFAVFVVPPLGLSVIWALRSGGSESGGGRGALRALGVSILVGAAIFTPWWTWAGRSAEVGLALASEPTGPAGLSTGLPWYLTTAAPMVLGKGGILLVVLGALATLRAAPDKLRSVGLQAAAALGVLLPHAWVPHREPRYLLPALPSLVAACVVCISGVRALRPWPGRLVALSLVLLAWGTLLVPVFRRWAEGPDIDYYTLELVHWADRNDFGVERFLTPLTGHGSGIERVLLVLDEDERDHVRVWLEAECLSRAPQPCRADVSVMPYPPAASEGGPRWLLTNALGSGAVPSSRAPSGWTERSSLHLPWSALRSSAQEFYLFERTEGMEK